MRSSRLLLKREEGYALHAPLLLAEEPGLSAQEIAEKIKAPPAFMTKVLQKLAKAGLVEGQVGRNGGTWLKEPPEAISLLRIMEVLSGPVVLDPCLTLRRCPTEERRGFCLLKPTLAKANQAIREELGRIRLAELLP